ncbi:MAG: LysM peptidoglycan-binding domain-containing protein [Candidatus Promineifilaceae bacterium]
MNSSIAKKFKLRFILLPLVIILLLVVFVPGAQASGEANNGYYHVVQYGETLSQIAYNYGTTVYAIAYANGIVNPNWIYAGMVLYVPYGYDYGYGYGYCRFYHTVGYGDTLTKLGAWYGTSPWAIASANNIYNLNLIYSGQVLCIP